MKVMLNLFLLGLLTTLSKGTSHKCLELDQDIESSESDETFTKEEEEALRLRRGQFKRKRKFNVEEDDYEHAVNATAALPERERENLETSDEPFARKRRTYDPQALHSQFEQMNSEKKIPGPRPSLGTSKTAEHVF